MVAAGIKVEGLTELRAELRKTGPKLPRALGKVNKTAAELVAKVARANATSRGGSAAKGIDQLKATATQRAATISLGGKKAPWLPGAEFGALGYRQFPAWKGNQFQPDTGNVGYFLHPAIRDTKDEFLELYGDLLDDLLDRAFPD